MVRFRSSNCLSSFFNRMRNHIIERSDPSVYTRINSQRAQCPFSHMLAFYQREFPLYDRQLQKICDIIIKTTGRLSVIDVGANIGDTVLNIGYKDAYYLLFEGDTKYEEMIHYNLREYDYDLESLFLTDSHDASYSCETSDGTGHLVRNDKVTNCMDSLDNVLDKRYPSHQFDILKVDTDGFDFKVIRGGWRLLQSQNPLVFFEWDRKYLEMQDEDYLSIFSQLDSIGYGRILLFDNFGLFLCALDTVDIHELSIYAASVDHRLIYYHDILAIPTKWKYLEQEIVNAVTCQHRGQWH